jgi:hypothetical protein
LRFDRQTSPWGVAAVAALLGMLIWALSPAISGHTEPWDPSASYYLFALPVAGFVSGLLAGKPMWAQFVGVIGGQFAYGLIYLGLGPLMVLGMGFLAVYGVLFLAGCLLGFTVRNAMAAQDRAERGHMTLVRTGAPPAFLDQYTGQSSEALVEMQATHRIDSIVLAFEEAIAQKRTRQPISREELYVLTIEALEREMGSGGYIQFFSNASGEFMAVIVEALKAVECTKAAIITQDAIDSLAVGADYSPARIQQAVMRPEVMRRLAENDVLYASNDERVTEQVFRWIEANPARIDIGSARAH